MFEKLRQFDAYPKTLEDFRIKTFGGATGTNNIHYPTSSRLLTIYRIKDLYSRKDTNLVFSRVARFYATTEQKLINSF